MVKGLVTICPRCNEKLIATKLSCDNCELELNGDFPLSKFDYLSSDELDFVESFLSTQGNFKTLQIKKGMSYPAVKKKFNDILNKLNLFAIRNKERNEAVMITAGIQSIKENDRPVVKKNKEKLNANDGRVSIPLYSGDFCESGTYGFEVLWENRRLDLSVEALVLRPEYYEVFTVEEREICENRLKEFGYEINC